MYLEKIWLEAWHIQMGLLIIFMLVLYNALVALTAGKLKGGAGGGGHPEVAGASVEDDVEALARGPQLDGAIVLGLMQRSKVFLRLFK